MRGFLRDFGASLGLPAAENLRLISESGLDRFGMEHLRFQQTIAGVPVTDGEISFHLAGHAITSVLGRIAEVTELPPPAAIRRSMAKQIGQRILDGHLTPSLPAAHVNVTLEVFCSTLVWGHEGDCELAWRVGTPAERGGGEVWVSASDGSELLFREHTRHALRRFIHASDEPTNCDFGPLARGEGDPPTGDRDIDLAYDATGDTYDYFMTMHGRDSYDGEGADMVALTKCGGTVVSTWNGSRITVAHRLGTDDIVGHEWTHGVIQSSIGNAGDMNESYADIFGETIDLWNGNDTAEMRWALFEDIVGVRGVRHMRFPGQAVSVGPGRMGEYDCSFTQHQNGGVTNHAYALIADGGDYNGYRITGIGLVKAAAIHYRALTLYLFGRARFRDNAQALREACLDLQGAGETQASDCAEVESAIRAVEMDFPRPCFCGNGRVDNAEICDDGNRTNGDGCDSNCLPSGCGNGITAGREDCDGGACCDADCRRVPNCPPCAGDCNADGRVTIAELVGMVRLALGAPRQNGCVFGDGDFDSQISVGEIITAVRSGLDGCELFEL